MTRIPIATVEDLNVPENLAGGYTFRGIANEVIEVNSVMAGMIDQVPRDQVPQGSGRVVRNARVREYWLGRRPGTAPFGGTAPNTNEILGLITFIREDGTVFLCRITATTFHVLDASLSGWISYAILDSDGNATSFIGARNRVSATQFLDTLFIADGINPIWKVDFDAQKIQQIEDAPKTSFITTFAERIVAGNVSLEVGGVRPSTLIWPVNLNPEDWTGLGSGREDLAAGELGGNEIAGLFALGQQMIVLRRNSIWHVTRQPFARAPFRMAEVIGGLGCDLPHSAVKVPNGIIFADQRTREVYFYAPGNRPQPLNARHRSGLLDDIINLNYAQGTLDPYENEYHLGIVLEGDTYIERVWTLNLNTGAWTFDDSPIVSALGVVSLPGGSVKIDELIGSIDAQSPSPDGTIDDYGSDAGFTPTLFKGTSAGVVLKQSFEADDDSGVDYDLGFVSPNLGSVSRRRTLKDVGVNVEPGSGGSYTLEQSKDEVNWRNTKTTTVAATDQIIRLPKTQITGQNLYWRLTTNAPGFRMLSWWARILEKGLRGQDTAK